MRTHHAARQHQRQPDEGIEHAEHSGARERAGRDDDTSATYPGSNADPHQVSRTELARILFAELFGTWLLTLAAAGPDVMGAAAGQPLSQPARLLPQGFIVAAIIYAIGNISGAHINPAVTLAFAIRRDFPWRRVPLYWLAQVIGAVCAALLLDLLFGDAHALGANRPSKALGDLPAVLTEMVLTCILVVVILATAHEHKLIGPNAALAVGLTLAGLGLMASPVTGASMNPARSLGPDLVRGEMRSYWIYLVGPMAGAILACGIAWILNSGTNREAVEAATGQTAGH